MKDEQRRALMRRLRGDAPGSTTEMKRAPSDARPAPGPGDLVGYRADPELFGAMLCWGVALDGPWAGCYACELDPPAQVDDDYVADIAHFRLHELAHADELWKGAAG